LTTYTAKLDDAQGAALEKILKDGPYRPKDTPYARASVSGANVQVTLYTSGKLVVQGKGTREFVEFVLEPQVLGTAKLGYETVLDPSLLDPRIGVDEAGKGDFFGPLCIAGVYFNGSMLGHWKEKGIKDSKGVSSDKRIIELAKVIRETPGCVVDVISIGPEAYNRLWAKNRSVNRILAWGHARVIENLLERREGMRPPPVRAISDQFAREKSTVERALMELGRGLELVQRHKAEEDMAVAAASILAREAFVLGLGALEKTWRTALPKGASAAVDAAAKGFAASHGAEALGRVSKTHFRTYYRALGLPEPAAFDWKAGRAGAPNPGTGG
jgi:ribonuclease HIII